MTRTGLNKFRKDRSNKNHNAYKKQQKVQVKTFKTAIKILYNDLDVKKKSEIINFSLKRSECNFTNQTL